MLAARLQSGQPTAGEFYELTAIAATLAQKPVIGTIEPTTED
jgi:ribose/xylose/arabinose/galactoside ABC-type transport system permease subunit